MGRGGRRNLLLILASLALAGGGAAQTRTELVSVSSAGEQGNHRSWAGALSPDGRFVVFGSVASNLVPGDTNARGDVLVRGPLPLTSTEQPRRPLGRFGQSLP